MKRSAISLEQVADVNNLADAFWRAARGRRGQPDVARMAVDLDVQLAQLSVEILGLSVSVGHFRRFRIHDPKPRIIHAPCFRERVLHHALMNVMAPVIDRALVDDTFACRPGKGCLAAAHRAQHHVRRFPWYVKADVRAYYASIDHDILRAALRRRFKNPQILALCDRIIDAYQTTPGKGLPIGALTSQHFANLYLAPLDRYLLETLRVAGMARYMDDAIWWCSHRQQARQTLAAVARFVTERLALHLHDRSRIQRSAQGLSFLGFRIFPGVLRLSRRRQTRHRRARQRWEARYQAGVVDSNGLQAGYAAALAITTGAQCHAWRGEELRRRPPVDA